MPKFVPLPRRNVLHLGRVRDAGLHDSSQRDGGLKPHFQASQPVPALRTMLAPRGARGCLCRCRAGW